jgi:hypothetical protein
MNNMTRTISIGFILALAFSFSTFAYAQTSNTTSPPLSIKILSANTLSGIAGDYVTVQGQITNTGASALSDVTTYLSLVDNENKLPVDLEDWSAEKGLFIGTIDAGQTLPLNWKIHFVKAGNYSLIIVAEAASSQTPQVSTVTHFSVAPKKNLNPGQVLPVALGTPIVLICLLFFISYRRKVEE